MLALSLSNILHKDRNYTKKFDIGKGNTVLNQKYFWSQNIFY